MDCAKLGVFSLSFRLRSHRSIRYTVYCIRYTLFAIRYTGTGLIFAKAQLQKLSRVRVNTRTSVGEGWYTLDENRTSTIPTILYYTRLYGISNSALLCDPVCGNPIVRFKLFACPRKRAPYTQIVYPYVNAALEGTIRNAV